MKSLLLLHTASTLSLVGLIWTIQLVHYPLFEQVGRDTYPAYQAAHQWRITLLVLPLMLINLFIPNVVVHLLRLDSSGGVLHNITQIPEGPS